jgi:hypothetical protein
VRSRAPKHIPRALADQGPPPLTQFVAQATLSVDAGTPIEIVVESSGISFLICSRDALTSREINPDRWAVPGCYVLLGEPSSHSAAGARAIHVIRARPGMSKGDVLNRLDRHLIEIDWFDRVVLIREERGMNSATAGYLEGKLHDLCRSAVFVEHDNRRDYDDSKQPSEKAMLESLAVPLLRGVLELVGVPLETEAEVTAQREQARRKRDDAPRPVK